MNRTELTFEALSSIRGKLWSCEAPGMFLPTLHDEPFKFLLVELDGEFDRRGTDWVYLYGLIRRGWDSWDNFGVVLDFTALTYEWGDQMANVLVAARSSSATEALLGSIFGAGFPGPPERYPPTAVVVSDRCREGMTSLVRDEIGEDPAVWLHETLDDAVEAIHQAYLTP